MTCPHKIEGVCLLASMLVDKAGGIKNVICKDDAEKACTNCACPNTYNYVVCSLAYVSLMNEGIKDSPIHRQLKETIHKGKQCVLGGPGTELKRLLSYLHILPETGCDCEWNSYTMDQWGPIECRKRVGEIVEWMRIECIRRNWQWKWNESASRTLIFLACDLSEGETWTSIILRLPSTLKQAYAKATS